MPKRLKAKAVPASRVALQEALRRLMPDRSVLDVLWDTNEDIHWTRHFGPISGSDPKLAHPEERYVITSFAYDTNYVEYDFCLDFLLVGQPAIEEP